MVVAQSLVVWTLKTTQIKLIHVLGGYTEEEYNKNFNNGYYVGSKDIATVLKNLTTTYYGCSKQTWIDKIYNAINNFYYSIVYNLE